MLKRGEKNAKNNHIFNLMKFTKQDINSWKPKEQYDIILANQFLHHVNELECLITKIYESLNKNGYFLTDDMIGKNGHMRWPEALKLIKKIWKTLPKKNKYNHQLNRFEIEYDNWDCSKSGFEGIRSQDILPLLIKSKFSFDLFFSHYNIVDIFFGRGFGHNYNEKSIKDRSFVDKINQLDEKSIESGEIKPVHIIAALTKSKVKKTKIYKNLTPDFCVRWPD